MDTGDLIWGIVMICGGVFIGIYGDMLFKFVLAMIGFLVGFSALYLILEGQDETLRIIVSFAAGGVGALVLFRLVNFGIYVAGAALGAVAGLLIAGLIGLSTDSDIGWLTTILVLVGGGGVGFLGPRLGAMIIPLGTSAIAAFMMTYGYLALFQSTFNFDASEPSDAQARRTVLLLFAMVYALCFLAQYNLNKLRQRIVLR
jgi:hypothetical protein